MSKVETMNISRIFYIFKIFHNTINVNCERLLWKQYMFKPTAKVLPIRSLPTKNKVSSLVTSAAFGDPETD